MTRVFLTGGTGFIGGHVARALLESGYEVRALARPGQKLALRHPKLTTAEGDVRDRRSVEAAVAGCDAVIHTAAIYSFWSQDPGVMYDVNVDGTHNVLRAARQAGVERIVHTSTVSTIKFRQQGLATEEDITGPEDLTGDYKRSKWEAERLAARMAEAGAPVVIVNPTAPMGAGDAKPTPTGGLVLRFLQRKMPAIVNTGLNVVDVRDVADGHVLALERGKPGERYLLGSTEGNLMLGEILRKLSALTGLSAPRLKLPHRPVLAWSHVDTFITGGLLHRHPMVPVEAARMATKRMWVDPSKAVRELGVPQRPVDGALREAVRWFSTSGYVTGRALQTVLRSE